MSWRQLTVPVLSVLFAATVGYRVWRYAQFDRSRDGPAMPDPIDGGQEQELYLLPGGSYSSSDIEANGRMTASRKYRGFRARHDSNPQLGERLCPVTRTKANPQCTWVLGGEVYQFCCPPCIDEFVRSAKEAPDSIHPPDFYVKK